MQIRKVALTLALASATGLALAEPASAGVPLTTYTPILTWGGPTFVKFIGYSAALRSESWFFGTVNPGPSQNPALGSAQYLFANKTPPASSVLTGAQQIGGNAGNKYAWNQLTGAWAPNTELIFGLYVQNLMTDGTDVWFYTGDPTYNADQRIHALITPLGKYHYSVGFEDLCQRAIVPQGIDCTKAQYTVDWDYNDHIFEVYSTPEPVSLSLLGTGLLGLAGFARRRRKQQHN